MAELDIEPLLKEHGASLTDRGILLANNQAIGWAPPPDATIDDIAISRAIRLVRLAVQHASKRTEIMNNARLSEGAKADDLYALDQRFRPKIAELAGEIRQLLNARRDGFNQAAQPAALSRTDAVGAAVDREVRDHFRSLSLADATALLGQAGPDLAAALLRSPLPLAPELQEAAQRVLNRQLAGDPGHRAARREFEFSQWAVRVADHVEMAFKRVAAPPRAVDMIGEAAA